MLEAHYGRWDASDLFEQEHPAQEQEILTVSQPYDMYLRQAATWICTPSFCGGIFHVPAARYIPSVSFGLPNTTTTTAAAPADDATKHHRKQTNEQQVMGALEAAGYRTSGMHKEPLALKTDAPDAAVWDVLRCWARENPQPPPVRAAGLAILDRGTQMIDSVDFEATPEGAEGRAGGGAARGRGRFLHAHNPEQDWGPLGRRSVMAATGEDRDEYDDEEENAGKPAAVLLSE